MGKFFRIFLTAVFSLAFFATGSFAEDTIKIGVQAPITGKYANEGQGIDQGVRLIVDQYNAKGGILGKKLEVVSCDDEGTAMKAAICSKNLVNEGVIAVIGSYTSTCAAAAQKEYFKNGVLQTSDGTADNLTANNYWTFFRNSFPNSAEGVFSANYFVNVKKYKKIAIVSDFSSFSDGLANAVAAEIKKIGGEIVYRGKIKAGSQNYTPVLTKIKSKRPDVIYFSGYYPEAGLLRSQQLQLGIKADFVGGNACDNPDFMKLAGKAAPGSYLINVPTPDMLPYDLAKVFLADYEAKYKMLPPSIWTLLNIDGLRVILHAMEVKKTIDTKVLADYLHNDLKDYPGITGKLEFASNGDRTGSAHLAYEIQSDLSRKVVYPTK